MRRIELVKTAMVATVIATSALMAGCGKKAPEINTEEIVAQIEEKKEQVDKAIEDVNEASEKLSEKIDAIEVPAPKEAEKADNEMGYTHEQAEKLTREEWAKVDEAINEKLSENPEKYASMTLDEYVGEDNVELYYKNVYEPRMQAVMKYYKNLEEIYMFSGEIQGKSLEYVMSPDREADLIEYEENYKIVSDVMDGTYVPDPNEKSVAEQIAELQNPSDDYVFEKNVNPLHGEGGSGDDVLTNGSTSGIFHPGD
ncbi:MAG: hypothetical protein J6X48_10435 [Lachnospiraceae bacterium]|nr:hypothetical protein [Lachnospiraceae bacterium]